jgi:hypothetical protein
MLNYIRVYPLATMMAKVSPIVDDGRPYDTNKSLT